MTMTIPGIVILSMTLIQMMTSMITQHSVFAFHDIYGIITSGTYKELEQSYQVKKGRKNSHSMYLSCYQMPFSEGREKR